MSNRQVNDSSSSEDEARVADLSGFSERRRRHDAIFARWIKEKGDKQLSQELQAAKNGDHAANEEMSIQELVDRHANKKIIETPREYQLELFERAKQRNTLAVLDTGSGKTLIAALLMRWVVDQELQHRSEGGRPRVVFFIVSGVALAFQQHSVLECNLDCKILKLYGQANVDLYTQDQWDDHLRSNMVVVCTAEILHQCLMRSFVSIAGINLLIFDEAHHAKKNHSFSRIMKDYYHKSPKESRPKVFGMTASPVDAKVDVVQAAKDLEAILDSQIATSRLLALARPREQILPYERPPEHYKTKLSERLLKVLGQVHFFDSTFRNANQFTATLGEWCSDQYWRQCFSEDALKLENQYKQYSRKHETFPSIQRLNQHLKLIGEAREIVDSHIFLPPLQASIANGLAISSKVRVLKWYLDSEFENPTESRCIVFVGHRQVAFLLAKLFEQIGSPNLRCAAMVGTRPPEVGEIPFSLTAQIRALSKFEKGEYNCLFATTVAEEGLDIADCNLIIRFDLYNTMIQYVQSRGRARHHNSKYVHMIEKGNIDHEARFRMARESEQMMRDFVEKLPADRLLLGSKADIEQANANDKNFEQYKEEKTGATLSFYSSLVVLQHFLDCLPQQVETPLLQPTFVIQPVGKKFICEIVLPENAPIHSIIGKPKPRKGWAKQSAAFQACLKLRQMNVLNGHFMPTMRKALPSMRNAQLAVDEHKKSSYAVRTKPDCWQRGWGTIPSALHATVFDFADTQACGRPHVGFALLTREPIPSIPSFQLWPQPHVCSDLRSVSVNKPLPCDSNLLGMLTSFTLRMFNDVYNKQYERNDASMSYWIAPLKPGTSVFNNSIISNLIDWQAVAVGSNQEEIKWRPDLPQAELVGRYLIDPGDGSRRFFTEKLETNLKPSDRPPDGVAPVKSRYMATILDYSSSTWGASRGAQTFDPNQPVLKAYKPTQRRNIFQKWSKKEQDARNLAYVCPEPLRISPLSTEIVAMAYIFPAIIWRVESYMIAQEACHLLGLTIDTSLALEALTKDSDNTEEHQRGQVNVQRGMGRNYERLEFLGDCFLKMATTISIFTRYATDDEFESHVKRMVMICNKTLFLNAKRRNLYEYIRAEEFSRRTWYPEGLKLLKGKGANSSGKTESMKTRFSDKTIADVCEALIGAALLSTAAKDNMDMAVKAVKVMVDSEDHQMEKWSDYYEAYVKPSYQVSQAAAAQIKLVGQVSDEVSTPEGRYTFRHPRLLQSAFTHPSYPFSWDYIPNYQRLEFLGDALLDMVAVNFLYRRYPDKDPQWLTEHKMAIVSNRFLGAVCVHLGFNRHLRTNNSQVMTQIKIYCEDIEEARQKADGAVDYWTQVAKDPPKCLADVVEAYIGALFVDSEYSFHEVEKFFDGHIAPFFADMTVYDTFANNHPMIALANMLTETYECQDFRIMSEEIPNADGMMTRVCSVAMIHDKIVADAWSTSSRYGKIKVASKAKQLIEGLAPFEYRDKYGCNCNIKKQGKGEEQIPGSQNLGTAV